MTARPSLVALVSCTMMLGCAAEQVVTPSPPPSAATKPPLRAAAAAAPAPAVPPPVAGATAPHVELPTKLELDVVRVLDVPVGSIALGEGTRVAVLSDPPQVGDARGFKPLPLPPSLRAKAAAVDRARIFFGRDNEPRIMGARSENGAETAIYWRHTARGGRDGREEIGQLGGTLNGGLWGVLGGEDPELVCRSNALCIIKRNTGWQTAPAGVSARIVSLQDGSLWGLDASGIAGIDAHGWALAIPAPEWSEPSAFWATRGEAWVSTGHALFHFHAGAWSALPLPMTEVTAWWGARPNSLWLVGKGAIAHFDGQRFSVAPAPGSLRAIRGRSDDEVWFGGDAGLFRARLIAP